MNLESSFLRRVPMSVRHATDSGVCGVDMDFCFSLSWGIHGVSWDILLFGLVLGFT